MKKMRCIVLVSFALCVAACKSHKGPDVSAIQVNLQVQRFEQDFFSIDTNAVSASMETLHQKYPGFLQDYIFNILGLPPQPDSGAVVQMQVRNFIRSYKQVKDSADKIFTGFDKIAAEIKQGLKYVKYYFPQYKLPPLLRNFWHIDLG